MKNTPSQHGDRWELDWIGSLPGKRESFRYIGDHVLTQNDIESEGRFPDTVCHGGWPMDDHFPQGYRYRDGQTIMHHAPTPYGIPYRSLYSRNVENLFFAGRNASVSHMALSSTRVMGTCAVMGQAVGTAAALTVRYGTTPRGVYGNHIGELQSILQEQDQFLPFFKRLIPELSAKAALSHEILRDGVERTLADGDHGVWFAPGETCSYSFDSPVSLRSLRFIVDTDCTDNRRLRLGWETRNGYRKMPPMMPRDVSVEILRNGEWKCIHEWTDLHQRCITFALKEDSVSGIRLVWRRSWGGDRMHVFAFDVR